MTAQQPLNTMHKLGEKALHAAVAARSSLDEYIVAAHVDSALL